MPNLAEQLSSYATSLHYRDLPAEVVHLTKRMIIDTIGCALGGYTSEPSKIARDLAGTVTSTQPASIIGSGLSSSPDLATFANGVMIRYLDYNDGYTSKESGHPSDSIAAVLAATEMASARGRRAITATVVAYAAFCRIGDAAMLKYIGFDHVTNGCIASTLGAARSLGLSPEQTFQAVNLGVAPNIALGQTRLGNLSHWKGCAYANASRNAVFATMLAQRGLTGPSPIFEGESGFFKAVSHEAYELEPFGGNGQPFKIAECSIKRFPLGQYSQTVVQAALEVREQLPDVNDIAQVNIKTLQRAIDIMAGDPESKHEAKFTTRKDVTLYSSGVHMHYRGKDWTYIAHFPDGSEKKLLSVTHYDFNWQESYIFRAPLKIPAGTKIECIAHYDNSPGNFANPDPSKSVRWGDQTWEEMMIGYVDYVPAK